MPLGEVNTAGAEQPPGNTSMSREGHVEEEEPLKRIRKECFQVQNQPGNTTYHLVPFFVLNLDLWRAENV